MRRITVAGAAIAAACSLAGCSSGSGDPTGTTPTTLVGTGAHATSHVPTSAATAPSTSATLRVGLLQPRSLVPADAAESSVTEVLPAIFSPLLRLGADGSLEPLVAVGMPESSDAVTWSITVDDGWTFHDGEPVTAQSFVDGWNLAASSLGYSGGFELAGIAGFDAVISGEATTLTGLRAVDPMTVEVTLAAADASFPVVLASVVLAPMSSRCLRDPPACESRPNGNGPFQVAGSWAPGEVLVLERYERWRGLAPARSGRIEIHTGLSDAEVLDRIDRGELDLARLGAGPDGPALQPAAHDGVPVDAVAMPALTALHPAAADPRLADPRMRTAISQALDRTALAAVASSGDAVPAAGLTPPGAAGHHATVCGTACVHDPAAARAAYDLAGAIVGPLPLTYSGDFGNEDAFALVAAQLERALGVDVELRPVGSAELGLDPGAVREGLVALGWSASTPVSSQLVARWSGALGRELGYENPLVDDLVRRSAAARSFEDGLALAAEAERAVLADLPSLPLWFRATRWARSSALDGFTTSAGAPRWELLAVDR